MAELRFSSGGGGGVSLSVTGDRVLVSNAAGTGINAAAATNTEAGYLSGVTSSIQTQLNAKRSTASGKVITDFQTSVLGAVFTTVGTGYEDTGLSVTVTVAATTDIVDFSLMAWGNSSTSQRYLVAYKVDSATTQLVMATGGSPDGINNNMSFRQLITGLSAGTHTIKIQMKVASGTCSMQWHALDNEVPTLNAIVYA